MKFQDLKKSLTNGIKNIYLVEGEDAFLRDNSLRLLKENFLLQDDLNLNNFNGQELKEGTENFFTAVYSYPFMSDKRFVVVYEYYPTLTELKNPKFKKFFSEPNETTVVIFINSNSSEALKKQTNVEIVDCNGLDDEIIKKWIRNEALKEKVIISQDAIQSLIDFTSGDMTKISIELNKLIAYVGYMGQISSEEVLQICVKDTDYQIYEFTEFVANKKYDSAYKVLNEMLEKNQDKQRLFISIYYHFRTLLYASISSQTDDVLANSLNVRSFVIKKAKIQAKSFGSKKLKQICDKLGGYDSAFKSGELTVDSVLWNSVFNAII